jgi:hypothetical protein
LYNRNENVHKRGYTTFFVNIYTLYILQALSINVLSGPVLEQMETIALFITKRLEIPIQTKPVIKVTLDSLRRIVWVRMSWNL